MVGATNILVPAGLGGKKDVAAALLHNHTIRFFATHTNGWPRRQRCDGWLKQQISCCLRDGKATIGNDK